MQQSLKINLKGIQMQKQIRIQSDLQRIFRTAACKKR